MDPLKNKRSDFDKMFGDGALMAWREINACGFILKKRKGKICDKYTEPLRGRKIEFYGATQAILKNGIDYLNDEAEECDV